MDLTQFLKNILQIESSGGKDTDHRRMTAGMHKGEAAMGGYGIMPNTAEEFIGRRKRRGQFGPDEAIMSQLSGEELKEFLQSQPRVEENLAEDIAKHVQRRSKGNAEKAAYMWNMGHNLSADKITQEMLDASPYVQKFRRLKEKLAPKEEKQEEPNKIIIP